jgi:pheromone shutdown-related protein TraB
MAIRIIGTGHILQRSVDEVSAAISEWAPDVVTVELDPKRFHALEGVDFDPRSYRGDVSVRELLASLVGGGSFPVFLEGVLALIQKELGERYGIYPGSDMCAAITSARDSKIPVTLIDRDIGITMNRLMRIPLREILHLFLSRNTSLGLASGLFDGNIEGILEKENLERIMDGLKKELPATYNILVDERDRYMAHALYKTQKANPDSRILAVVGAGHRRGILGYLEGIEYGRGPDMYGIMDVRPVPATRIIFLAFMAFAALILIKSGLLFGRGK